MAKVVYRGRSISFVIGRRGDWKVFIGQPPERTHETPPATMPGAWAEQRTLAHGGREHVVRRGDDGVYHLGAPPKPAFVAPPIRVAPPEPKKATRRRAPAEPKRPSVAKRSAKVIVEAKVDFARTNEGRIQLIDRLEEYERQHQLAPLEPKPAHDYVRENIYVESALETKKRIYDNRRASIAKREHCIRSKNAFEQQELTRRNLATRRFQQVTRKRNEKLAKCVARLARSQGSARCRRWLTLYSMSVWTLKRADLLATARRKSALEKRMRSTLLVVRFLRKTCKTRALHRAAATILYVATLLKAQNGFRMACKKLCFSVVLSQRWYRRRSQVTCAAEALALLQWLGWARGKNVARVAPEVRHALIRSMLREKRQKHFLAVKNWEQYDLKPLLVEAVAMSREMPRKAARAFGDDVQKRGDMARVALGYGVDVAGLRRPRLARLLHGKDIAKLQQLGAQQMEIGERNLLLGLG